MVQLHHTAIMGDWIEIVSDDSFDCRSRDEGHEDEKEERVGIRGCRIVKTRPCIVESAK